tara:strand:- start:1291 stop:2031 length:741 start_codon:yes stop_codon:yes gene_type:complete
MTKKIMIKPSGQELEIDEEKSILEALKEKGIYIKSSCGGVASCTDCRVKILSGEDSLTTPPFEEVQLLGNVFHITKERLSCQTKICGDEIVILDISGHNKEKDNEALRNKMKKGSLKKSSTRVRKNTSIDETKEQRRNESAQKRSENKKKWFRTWDDKKEVTEDEVSLLSKVSSGGHRRPKGFKTEGLEDFEESRGKDASSNRLQETRKDSRKSGERRERDNSQGKRDSKSSRSNSKRFNKPLKKK